MGNSDSKNKRQLIEITNKKNRLINKKEEKVTTEVKG